MRIVARMDAVPEGYDGPRDEAGVLRQCSGTAKSVEGVLWWWVYDLGFSSEQSGLEARKMIAIVLNGTHSAGLNLPGVRIDCRGAGLSPHDTAQAGAGPGLSNDNGGGAQVPALQDGEGARGCE